MIYRELLPSVDLQSWQITSTSNGTLIDRSVKPEIIELYKKIMERDGFNCYYCGFHSEKWQEIHHLNDNHFDYSESNLVTVCPLCHQNHHLNSAYINNGAELIWLPELTQQELNYICRALFVANQIKEDNGKKYNHFIANLGMPYLWHNLFYTRKKLLDKNFGEGCSDLSKFAQVLLDIKKENPKHYLNRSHWIKGFKLLHKPRRFHVQVQYWKEEVFKELPLNQWINFATQSETEIPEKEFNEINDNPLV